MKAACCSGRKPTTGALTVSHAKERAAPVDPRAERQKADERPFLHATRSDDLVVEDRNRRRRRVTDRRDVGRNFLVRHVERLAHGLVDALVGLVRDEQVDVLELHARAAAASQDGLGKLRHGVLEHVAPLHPRNEQIAVDRLKPFRRNARTHSRKQIKQIAESIRRFGFTNPILIDDDDGMIAGHGRVEAAKTLGMPKVPTICVKHLTPERKRAFVLADNRLAELAGWDRDTLAIELQGLIELDFDVEVTGFDMGEIELILHDEEEDEGGKEKTGAGEDTAKSTCSPAVSRRGDVWLLGAHQLTCGDLPDEGGYAAVDAAIRHWQKSTGISATLAGCGQTFKAIAQKRRKQARRGSGPAAVPRTPEAA